MIKSASIALFVLLSATIVARAQDDDLPTGVTGSATNQGSITTPAQRRNALRQREFAQQRELYARQHQRDLSTSPTEASPAPVPAEPLENFRLEYAQGTYRLTQDSTAYSRPSLRSQAISAVGARSSVKVTGATSNFVQVRLTDNQTAYVPISAVALFRSANRDYWLTADSLVYSRPNLSAQRIAEVHQGRNAHIVGVELNYLKIRMHNGTEGYIPVSAVE